MRNKIFYLTVILFIGATLRIFGLDAKDLWHDEVISIYRFKEVRVNYDHHPPLYHILLQFWIRCFGKTEFAVRSLSVLAGIGSLFFLYKIGELLVNKKLGLISSLLLALSPLHIWYSQEARNYNLSVFLILVSAFVFLLCLKKDKFFLWTIFIAITSLSIYTSYFAFFIIIAEGILFFIKEFRPIFKKWAASIFLVFIISLPLLSTTIKQTLFIKESFWVYKPTIKSIIITLENFNIGYNGTSLMYILSWIFFLFFLIGVVHLFYYKRNELFLLLSFLFTSIVISFFISQFMPIYLDRQLILFSPFYYIIIAQGLIKLRPYSIRIFLLGIMSIIIGFSLCNYFRNEIYTPSKHHHGVAWKRPFKRIREYLEKNFKEGDIIAHTHPGTMLPLKYYYLDKNPSIHYYFVFPLTLNSYWRNIFYDYLKHNDTTAVDLSQQSGKQYVTKFKSIWLLAASWEKDWSIYKNSREVKNWMDSNFSKITEEQIDGILITFYKSK